MSSWFLVLLIISIWLHFSKLINSILFNSSLLLVFSFYLIIYISFLITLEGHNIALKCWTDLVWLGQVVVLQTLLSWLLRYLRLLLLLFDRRNVVWVYEPWLLRFLWLLLLFDRSNVIWVNVLIFWQQWHLWRGLSRRKVRMRS